MYSSALPEQAARFPSASNIFLTSNDTGTQVLVLILERRKGVCRGTAGNQVLVLVLQRRKGVCRGTAGTQVLVLD